MYEKVGSWNEILIDMSEFFHAILNFAAVMGKKPQSYLVKVPVKKLGEIKRTREQTYISLILNSCDLKFGMHVFKTLFYFTRSKDYTYCKFFLFI